ncbi:MAG: PTS transporter subunit EIIC [Peptococcaceae bacterium]|nr:PTS transporter subunit EIIC [Peptococcaceae bacterium]
MNKRFFKFPFENNIILVSVRKGMTLMIPPLLVGSFALIVLSFPVPVYQRFMVTLFGSQWGNVFQFVRDGTFNIMSLIMVLCISYSYAYEAKGLEKSTVNPFIVSVTSLCSFIALIGMEFLSY